MSPPRSEPAREQRVNRAAPPRVELFSHPPQAEASEQRPPLADSGDDIDWRATPFSGGAAEQRRSSSTRRTNAGAASNSLAGPSAPTTPCNDEPGAAGRG
jgi:hypothetical protein